jgi:ribosome maturation factor RimP
MAEPDLNRRRALEARITELAESLAASMEMEIVLVEIRGEGNRSIVRVYIDQPSGVSLGDCERFSRRLSVSLDVEDWIPSSYILEVSSPGVDRPLTKEKDFLRFCGQNARVRTRSPHEGQRNFKGRIAGVAAGRLELEVAPGRRVGIDLGDIERANLIGDLGMRPQGA